MLTRTLYLAWILDKRAFLSFAIVSLSHATLLSSINMASHGNILFLRADFQPKG
jgi:hypothetical protein